MYKALLFDMDGTLLDSDPTHFAAWREMLKRYDINLSKDQYKHEMSGRENSHIVRDFFPEWESAEVNDFIEAKEARFREMADQLEPMPGLLELLDWVKANNIKCALVTNAIRENMAFVLKALDLETIFDVTLSVDDVENGKPDPEIYKDALSHLGISAADSLAFEDSASGIRAAKTAGMDVIGVTSGLSAERLYELGVMDTISDFNDLILKLYIDM